MPSHSSPFSSGSAFASLTARFASGETVVRASGLQGPAKALAVAALAATQPRPILVVAPTEKEARLWQTDLAFCLGEARVSLLPPWDIVSLDMFAFQRETELQRIEALHRLAADPAAVVVAPVKALLPRLMPRADYDAYTVTIAIGDTWDRDALARRLLVGGYVRTPLVEAKGEFSVRGHILDCFPPSSPGPVRMEFIGDEIESIRTFDPDTQRSLAEQVDFVLTPAREILLDETAQRRAVRNLKARAADLELPKSVRDRLMEQLEGHLAASTSPLFFPLFYPEGTPLDPLTAWLPRSTLLVLDGERGMARGIEEVTNDLNRLLLKGRTEGRFYLEPEASFLSDDEVTAAYGGFPRLILESLALGEEDGDEGCAGFSVTADLGLSLAVSGRSREGGALAALVEKSAAWLQAGQRLYLVCNGPEDRQRMTHLLGNYALPLEEAPAEARLPALLDAGDGAGRLTLLTGRISGSIAFEALRLVLLSEEDIFGRKQARKAWRPVREGFFLKSFGELKEGDYVVHKEHGIGIYRGLEKLTVDGIPNDFLLLEYAGRDKLYLPVHRLEAIQRYVGPEGVAPRVEPLGGTSWEAVKEKVKKSIQEVAQELVAIYAAREVMERRPFAAPDRLYDEFCAAFEYEETPDQATAIEDIQADMDKAKPMDRLVCGDAGFGKTEVAMRSAFRAVMAGKQVAVLVPTTILAEQHYATFSRRFAAYPVRVETLNRLKAKAQQQAILDDLEKGRVDIVIGTHRLLSKDVEFRELGLVIVDEEQRFGVAHKERLKKLRTLVDVLTLTATPIPRTLHLSLVGLRDLSIMNTPPEDRQPIRTYTVEFDPDVIARAIRKELARGGQVFFLHDRVKSIYTLAHYLERLVPEARLAVVHGQMKPTEIEDAMVRFVRRDSDVLVCTTIIGAGLDIPSANTILINRADRFGLGQLYQIRGRVGRAKEEGVAYLIVPKGAMLSADAERRLQVIMDFTEPGSGFRIASNDLELRGAGNLLGLSQSGHVSAVGYELYTELMGQTIAELKGEAPMVEEVQPEIALGLSAFIPEAYMPDEHQRLLMYKRISMAAADGELKELRLDALDRFGPLPEEMERLLDIIRVRNRFKRLRGKKLAYDGSYLSLAFSADSPVDPATILDLARKAMKGIKLTPDHRLYIPAPDLRGGDIASRIIDILGLLAPESGRIQE